MRSAVGRLGKNTGIIEPLVPVDLVIQSADHAHSAEAPDVSIYPDFPDSLPCVSRIDGLGMSHNAALMRTPFEAGNTRQRRLHVQLTQQVQLSWRCNNDQLHPLFTWLNINGYEYFRIELSGVESSALEVFKTKVVLRLISDITKNLMRVHRQNWWVLSATAELRVFIAGAT